MARPFLLVALLLLCVDPPQIVAGEAPAERTAVDVALAASDRELAVRALAGNPTLEPWLVAERLRTRSGPEVALGYARLAGEEARSLEAYVRSAAPAQHEAALDALEDEIYGHIEAGTWSEGRSRASAGLGKVPVRTVLHVYFAMLLATCVEQDSPSIEAAASWQTAGAEALSLGWLAAAQEAFSAGFGRAKALGYWAGARDADRGLLAVQEARGDLLGQAHTHFELGQILREMGDLTGACGHLDEALTLYDELGRPNDVLEVRSVRSGVYAAAGLLREALEEQRSLEAPLKDSAVALLARRNVATQATIAWYLGDTDRALALLDRAPTGTADAELDLDRATRVGTRALLESQAGATVQAVEHFREAHGLYAKVGNSELALVARANLAYALLLTAFESHEPREVSATPEERKKNLVEALHLLEEVLPSYVAAGSDSARLAAQETRGRVLLALGELAAGRELLRRTADDAAAISEWSTAAHARTALAAHLLEIGSWEEAARMAADGLAVLAQVQGDLAGSGRVGPAAWRADLHEIGVAAAAELGDVHRMHEFLEGGRAAALLRGLGGREAALHAGLSAQTAERLAKAKAEKLALIRAYHKAVGSQEGAALWDRYKAAQRVEIEALQEAGKEEAAFAERLVPSKPRPLSQIRRSVTSAQKEKLPCHFVSFSLQPDRLYALVVDPVSERIVRYEPTALATIHRALEALLPQVAARATRAVTLEGDEAPHSVRELTAQLAEALLPPLKLPSGRSQVLVSPDGSLSFVPFGLLFGEEVAVALEPSASIWELQTGSALRRGDRVLAVGNPDYRASPDADVFVSRGGPRLGALPFTAEEIEGVASDPARDRTLLGPEATEARVGRELADLAGQGTRLRSLHLACHGLVDVEWPALSCLALTSGGGEDGFLTAAEVLRWHVDADLVVLSACQTGRGRFVRGEGVLSMARAFMRERTPRVLVSLWDVDDRATAFLMRTFYAEWRDGKVGAAEALRRAQKATRDHPSGEWADPRFWAAWVLWGLPD